MMNFKKKLTRAFTPLVEDGPVPKAFLPNGLLSIFNLFISKLPSTNIRHKNARPSFNTGFTLIELLTVIAIIGILSSVVLANLNGSRQKARDVKRIADIKQLQLALTLYFDVNSQFPLNTSSLVPNYMSVIPKDPTTNVDYSYTVLPAGCSGSACNDYLLKATLEQSSNPVLLNDADTTNSPIYDVKP